MTLRFGLGQGLRSLQIVDCDGELKLSYAGERTPSIRKDGAIGSLTDQLGAGLDSLQSGFGPVLPD
jgi:hypothetical protein